MTTVVDASVALKWFVAEPDSHAATRLLTLNEILIAPDLIVAELTNAAWRLWRHQELSIDQARIIADRAAEPFGELAACTALVAETIEIALDLDHPVYDCFYLALAGRRNARLVSADRRLMDRVRGTAWQDNVVLLEMYT